MLLCMKAKRKEQRKMKGTIICYGDSNTYGYDPQSLTGGRYPENICWTGILQEKSGWLIKNHGVNGRCIPHNSSQIHFFCEQLRDWCKIKGPVRIWIMLGQTIFDRDRIYRRRCRESYEKISSGTGSAAGN